MRIFAVISIVATLTWLVVAAEDRLIKDFGPNAYVVECVDGLFVLPKRDKIVSRYFRSLGQYERGFIVLMTDILNKLSYTHPGRPNIILDIGSNIGAWTVPLSRVPNATVYSFEPQRHMVSVLRSTLLINGITNVFLTNSAVGNSSGFIALNDVPLSYMDQEVNYGALSVLGILNHHNYPTFRSHSQVSVIALDDFYHSTLQERCPSFLKLDIEHYELYAFLGGRRMLRQCKPLLFFESNCYILNKPVFLLLASLGYELFWVVEPVVDYAALPFFGMTQDTGAFLHLPDHQFTETYFGMLNVVAVPAALKFAVQELYEKRLFHIKVRGAGVDAEGRRKNAEDIQFRVEDAKISYCVSNIVRPGSEEVLSKCGNFTVTPEGDHSGCEDGDKIPSFMADYWKQLAYILYESR